MNLPPINLPINILIHAPHHRHRVPPYNIQSQRYFLARLVFFDRPDDALGCGLEDQVHGAVAGVESADEDSAVEGEDADFLCGELEGGVNGFYVEG
jgi:hypothetical protein